MVVEEHEEPLMQLIILYKLGPSAPKVHLAASIIVHLPLVWCSTSRLFAEDRFTKLAPIHELGELQRNTLLLTALSTSNAEERIDLGSRRRRGIVRSSTRAWSSSSRYLMHTRQINSGITQLEDNIFLSLYPIFFGYSLGGYSHREHWSCTQ
jgi:hypothetical protein